MCKTDDRATLLMDVRGVLAELVSQGPAAFEAAMHDAGVTGTPESLLRAFSDLVREMARERGETKHG